MYYEVTGRSVCILDYAPAYDLSGPAGQEDCVVNLYDLAAFAVQWPAGYDFEEFAGFSGRWQSSGMYPQPQQGNGLCPKRRS